MTRGFSTEAARWARITQRHGNLLARSGECCAPACAFSYDTENQAVCGKEAHKEPHPAPAPKCAAALRLKVCLSLKRRCMRQSCTTHARKASPPASGKPWCVRARCPDIACAACVRTTGTLQKQTAANT